MTPADHIDTIELVLDCLGLGECKYPIPVILALIDVESDGDASAHREGSQFHGLLQMGRAAAKDVGLPDSKSLDGDAEAAIEAFLCYAERYAMYHDYDPVRIAILWKGGPGTAKYVGQQLAAGIDMRRAIIAGSANKGIPRLAEYVRRFRVALKRSGGLA